MQFNIEGNTPLHRAALKGSTEVIKDLLKAGANTDVKNKLDYTALKIANICGQTSARNILENAEKIKSRNERVEKPSTNPKKPDGGSKLEDGPAKGGNGIG